MTLATGTRLGRFEILGPLGSGGMGEVYRAQDAVLDRQVAVKVLPDEVADDQERLERFRREGKALAQLSHPNILEIHDMGSDQGVTYAVMELLEGGTLHDRMAGSPLPWREALRIGEAVADGLAAAHGKGIVHRDLKPANVFLTSDGRVKILDFGLARMDRAISREAETQDLRPPTTEPGAVMGTVGYMSPEQVRGEPADHRSDIFSLGCMLCEMLTGERAFARNTPADTLVAILSEEPSGLPEVERQMPAGVCGIVEHCLEKSPQRRYQSASDLGFALANARTVSRTGLDRVEPFGEPRAARRWPLLLVAGLGLVAGVLVMAALQPRSPAHPAPVRLKTLTYSGRDWGPCARPAGDLIAFVSDRDGVSRIWLKQVTGGGEVPLTEGPDDLPRFSPDGSQLLFVRIRGDLRELYRTSVVDVRPRKILEDVLEADWSPDGTRVAFLRMEPRGDENAMLVGVAEVQTGAEQVLAEVENRWCFGIRWSPDGTLLTMSDTSGTEYCVDLVDVSSGELERLVLRDWGGPYTASHWAPDSRSILVGQATDTFVELSDSSSQVMEYDLASKTLRGLFWAPLQMAVGGRGCSTIAVLGADQVVIGEHVVQSRLYELPWQGQAEGKPMTALTGGLARDRQPAYSPDGDRVIFSSNRSGNLDLWAVDRRSGALHQLTDDPANDLDPAFTPDGKRVLWTSDRGGNPEIWLAAADGSGARQVTRDGLDAENPTMTADGEWIVYASTNNDKLGVWKIRPDGSDATRLAQGSFSLPEVSPDGRLAVCPGNRGAGVVIQVVEIATGDLVPFAIELFPEDTKTNVVFGRARWTPDGNAIAFIAQDEEGRFGVFVQDFVPGRDTTPSRRAVAGFADELTTESLGISPDGTTLVVSAAIDRWNLSLADNVPLGW